MFGAGFFLISDEADINNPGVQIPHCAAPCFKKDFCKLAVPLLLSPSIVSIFFPLTLAIAIRQEHIASLSIIIVQEPQSPALHPIFVPFKPKFSLKTLLSLSDGSDFIDIFLPFSIKSIFSKLLGI